MVAYLLQDPRVEATVNVQSGGGYTALHYACSNVNEMLAASIIHLLLHAGANPTITNNRGETPLTLLSRKYPSCHAAIALLEQAPEAEKASLLVKAGRLVVATISNVVAPYHPACTAGRHEGSPCLAWRWRWQRSNKTTVMTMGKKAASFAP
jgi:ankyrin repeat protein